MTNLSNNKSSKKHIKSGIKGNKERLIPNEAYRFVGIFVLVLIVLITLFQLFEQFFAIMFLKPVSGAGYLVLSFIGVPITFSSEYLSLGFCDYVLSDQILRVNYGCTGLFVFFIFISAVVAYPARFKAVSSGLLFGIPLFITYSIVRLVIMGIIGSWFPQYLSPVHNYLMVIINAAFILWLYVFWIQNIIPKVSR